MGMAGCGGRGVSGWWLGNFNRDGDLGSLGWGPGPGALGWRSAIWGGGFLLVLAGLSFWRGAGRWAIILWGLDTLLIFPSFLRF